MMMESMTDGAYENRVDYTRQSQRRLHEGCGDAVLLTGDGLKDRRTPWG